MTPTSGDENPYQPPKAEIKSDEDILRTKRPASTKVALVFFALMTCANIKLYSDVIRQHGFQTVWEAQSLYDPSLFTIVGLVLGLVGKPRRLIYIGISLLLAAICFKFCSILTHYQQTISYDPASFAAAVIGAVLMSFLFYRFTFGLPSRRYYGMVREESPASEAQSSET